MDDPTLFYKYLRKAIQWGCEYIDVELWLPEQIRRKLAFEKGNSKIISAWHDYTGTFKWTSPQAQQLFKEASTWSDIVKMIAFINTMDDNYELEYFRSTVQGSPSQPPLSGLNMSSIGQLSRTLNRVFTPITHPLLPVIAAPGQLSAAEVKPYSSSHKHISLLTTLDQFDASFHGSKAEARYLCNWPISFKWNVLREVSQRIEPSAPALVRRAGTACAHRVIHG